MKNITELKRNDTKAANKLFSKVTFVDCTPDTSRATPVVSKCKVPFTCPVCGKSVSYGDFYYRCSNSDIDSRSCKDCPPVIYKGRLYSPLTAKYKEAMEVLQIASEAKAQAQAEAELVAKAQAEAQAEADAVARYQASACVGVVNSCALTNDGLAPRLPYTSNTFIQVGDAVTYQGGVYVVARLQFIGNIRTPFAVLIDSDMKYYHDNSGAFLAVAVVGLRKLNK